MKTVTEATRAFLEASRVEWGSPAAQKAMNRIQQLGPVAKRGDLDTAAALIAAGIGDWPHPEVGHVALTVGMLIEMGAAARPNVAALVATARRTVLPALRFTQALREAMPDREPRAAEDDAWEGDDDDDLDEAIEEIDDDDDAPPDALDDPQEELRQGALIAVSARMPEEAEAARAFPVVALAAIAALSRCPEERALVRRDVALLEQARLLANEGDAPGNAKFLATMLHVLDGEPLLVLHPPSGRGFEVAITGVADNFQLHTLLGATLVPLGLPGLVPAPEVAACARGEGPQMIESGAQGVFNLHHWTALDADGALLRDDAGHAPKETWLWNEGVPADIRAFEGRRVVVLGPPPYARMWQGGRLFSSMPASAEVTRELERVEVAAWAAKLGSAPRPTDPHVMHGGP